MPRGHDVHARAERRIRQDHTDTASAEFEHQLLSDGVWEDVLEVVLAHQITRWTSDGSETKNVLRERETIMWVRMGNTYGSVGTLR